MAENKKIEVENLDELVTQCLVVTDRKGNVLGKNSNRVSAWLCMEYKSDYGKITFDVNILCQLNGSYHIEIKDDRETLFEVQGNYIAGPFNHQVKKYVPGKWENDLKREYEKVK